MTISFRVKLLASHAAVALAVSAVALLVSERSVSQRMGAQLDTRLKAQAEAVAKWMERAGHPDRLAGRLAGVVGARVTIVDSAGELLGESSNTQTDQGGVEIEQARAGGTGKATRESVRYIAVPTTDQAIVRLGVSIGELDDTRSELRKQLAVGALASLLVALGLAALVAGPLTRRLREATATAEKIGAGDYAVGPSDRARDEVGILSATLVSAAAELKATEERRREFLATVAHEIRTPVTSIRGYTETLLTKEVDEETRAEFDQTVHRNAVRIAQLVEDLLELEALEAGVGNLLAVESVDIAQVSKHVTETLAARAKETGASIEVSIKNDLQASGDADAIERVILNLVDNALRHGGNSPSILVEGSSEGDHCIVRVTDDGPGIPSNQRARIFERFYRGDKGRERARSGTGLGLAIARELAIAMGGTLVLSADSGSTFVMRLPVGKPTGGTRAEPPS